MLPDLNKKLESKIDNKISSKAIKGQLFDGFKKNKTVNEVLDKRTTMTLFEMISSHTISYVNGAVSAGKESVVFWAVDGNGADVALKIYLVSTSNFKSRMRYIEGDPRFSRIRRGTKNLVDLWARKEFQNCSQCFDAGIRVPRPIRVHNNVLAMEFIGTGGAPARTLLTSDMGPDDYGRMIDILHDLYRKARLVHGDLSEYNTFKTESGLILFDLGSAVDARHPRSGEFLQRDINNITRFFVRRGFTVDNPADVYRSVVS